MNKRSLSGGRGASGSGGRVRAAEPTGEKYHVNWRDKVPNLWEACSIFPHIFVFTSQDQ